MFWLDHVGVVVEDLDASVDFYSQLFGSKPVDRAEWRGKNADYVADMVGKAHGVELEAVFFKIPHTNTLLELLKWSGIKQEVAELDPVSSIGATHCAFYADLLENALRGVRSGITGAPQDIPYGPCKGGRAAYFRDPNRINLQFMQLTTRPGHLPVKPPAPLWLDHVGIVVKDLDATINFYSRLFGTKIVDRWEWRGENADYVADMMGRPHGLELEAAFFQIPHTNTLLEMIDWSGVEERPTKIDPTAIGATHFAFYVDSLENALNRGVRSALTGAPQDIPYGPCKGGRAAYFRDPNGVNLQLMELITRPGRLPVEPSARP
jgi:catechol 2,3-dioxygenase-like lactoylglutathione lyase family enzyme